MLQSSSQALGSLTGKRRRKEIQLKLLGKFEGKGFFGEATYCY